MPLVKGGRIVADDFMMLDDEAPLPTGASVFVPAARFLADPQAHLQATNRLGVVLPNSRKVDDLVPWLGQLAAIALVFPGFRDGRAYSQARLLRGRMGYRGELRATGGVLQDQVAFMLRCGFDGTIVAVNPAKHYLGTHSDITIVFIAPVNDLFVLFGNAFHFFLKRFNNLRTNFS